MEPVSIHYRLSEKQFMVACNQHWSAHTQGSRMNILAGSVGVVTGLLLIPSMSWLAIAITISGSMLLALTFLRSWLWRQAYRDARKFTDNITIALHDDRIHIETADGISDLQWSYYTWYLETDDFLLLYASKRIFSVIPKAAFPDEETKERFLGLVRSRLLHKKTKRRTPLPEEKG